ncbi:MAG: hypothetical protein R3A44_01280 [Caldilineaceae bacterium]
MLRRQKTLFFTIIGVAIAVVIFTLAAERMQLVSLPSRAVVQTPIRVAMSPQLVPWARQAATDFGQRNADAVVSIVEISGMSAAQSYGQQSAAQLPEVWAPEAAFVLAIGRDEGAPFQVPSDLAQSGSLIQTDLTWGAFGSRAQSLGAVDWQNVGRAAATESWSQLGGQQSWGFFKLTIASPTRSAEGLAALLSAAAAYHGRAEVTRADVVDGPFVQWLTPIVESVPNFATLGADPAKALATRGPSVGDVGLLSGASWQRSLASLQKWEDFVISAPTYTVRLDYPYALRTDLSSAEQEMAARFFDFLLERTDQLAAEGFTAEAANGATPVVADEQAVLALFRWAERERIGQ